jgi:hypothetical protein
VVLEVEGIDWVDWVCLEGFDVVDGWDVDGDWLWLDVDVEGSVVRRVCEDEVVVVVVVDMMVRY